MARETATGGQISLSFCTLRSDSVNTVDAPVDTIDIVV